MGEAKPIIDVGAYLLTLSTFIGKMPEIAAGLSVLWLMVQLYDRFKYGPKRGK